ncbi:ABC transporter ATP-binding protein [Azospirillum largimobile]
MSPVLSLRDLRKSFGSLIATDGLSLDLAAGELHAIIGPNGAGKSTLIGQITGELRPDTGMVLLNGRDVTSWPVERRALAGLGRSFQITQLVHGFTVEDNVALAVQARAGHSFRFWTDARGDVRLRDPARHALATTGLTARADTLVEDLSHGEMRQLELAVALALQPQVLILDEPMAGMGASDSRQVVSILRQLKGRVTILLVEHDMDAVFALADRISVLVAGRIVASGTVGEIRNDPRVRAAYLGEEKIHA